MNRTQAKTRAMVRVLRSVVGMGVALASIGWVLFHLIGFCFRGYILVGENNPLILVAELILTTIGLVCFMTSLCDQEIFLKMGSDTGQRQI